MNAGLFVIDIEKWRTDRVQARSIEAVHRHPGINDEEALNIALQHDWLEISPRWTYFAIYLGLGLERALGPVVYHYYDGPKPWRSCSSGFGMVGWPSMAAVIEVIAGSYDVG